MIKNIKILSGIFLLFISSFAFAGGVTPFTDQQPLAHIQDSDLTTDWDSLTPLVGSDIETMVRSMRNKADTNTSLNNAIGIISGMVLRKDGVWNAKEIRNAEGLRGAVLPKKRKNNNITWYPDYMKGNQVLTESVRFTTGRFNMGAMPFWGQAFLEIPIENIRKEVEVVDNKTVATKYWFKADVNKILDENNVVTGYTTNLNPALNYYKVFNVKAPMLDFLGYYDVKTGEWKVKFVINSDLEINPSLELPDEPDMPSTHPDLDLEVYSHGTALQFPKP